ncbi:MAG: hypothetical protein ACUVV4_08150 [Candidatus Bathyarchaeia archaeon]
MKVKYLKITLLALLLPLVLNIGYVLGQGVGQIKIAPPYHLLTSIPITYHVYTEGAGKIAYDPHIFLAMSEDSWNALDNVTVSWGGGSLEFIKGNFNAVSDNSLKIPVDDNIGYTVASVKDHLRDGSGEVIGPEDNIYYVFVGFPIGEITNTPKSFDVDLNSESPNMMIYILGKSDVNGEFDMRTPPTPSGFVIPEPATISVIVVSMAGFVAYFKKRVR